MLQDTEASLDLAEDDELMELMGRANFQNVFIGIETPNEDSLRETKKYQNVRPKAGTLLERVHRVQHHGIDVWCGMIVGFDHDNPSIFEVMPKFLVEARISAAIISMLHAIPTTPLYDRLKQEERLNDDEASDKYGTNVIPVGMSREELRDGFVKVMKECYSADAYFQRLDAQFVEREFQVHPASSPLLDKPSLGLGKTLVSELLQVPCRASRLSLLVADKALRSRYRQQLSRVLLARWSEPHILFIYALRIAMHYHYAALTRALAQVETGILPNAGRSFSRASRRIRKSSDS